MCLVFLILYTHMPTSSEFWRFLRFEAEPGALSYGEYIHIVLFIYVFCF